MSANSINKCTNTTHSLSNPMLSTAHISWREVNTVQSDISFTLLSAAPPTQSQPIQTHFYLWHHNRNLYTPISLPASAHTLIKIDFFFFWRPSVFCHFPVVMLKEGWKCQLLLWLPLKIHSWCLEHGYIPRVISWKRVENWGTSWVKTQMYYLHEVVPLHSRGWWVVFKV